MTSRLGHTLGFSAPAVLAIVLCAGSPTLAEVVSLKSGVQLDGSVDQLAGLNPDPKITPPQVKSIIVVDDGMRRVFFGLNQLAGKPAASPAMRLERIKVPQRVARTGKQIFSVGMPLKRTKFDEHGWRTFTMTGLKNEPIDVIQGITVITPTYTELEALQLQTATSYIWSTRIATSSIPRDELSRVLQRVVGKKNADGRLSIVRLLVQSDRFQEAAAELEEVLKDFPELADKDLKDMQQRLRQSHAERIFEEIEQRRAAGQPLLALAMLRGFPQENVAGETLLKVRDVLAEFEALHKQGEKVIALLKEHHAALDEATREKTKAICEEIALELNLHTLDRMADYLRLADDAEMTAEQKLSLAISGWLLGSGAGIDNLSVSQSLIEVRRLVRAYLNSKAPGQRQEILKLLEAEEGSSPERITRIIAHMKPPHEPGAALAEETIDLGDAETILGPRKAAPKEDEEVEKETKAAPRPARGRVKTLPASKSKKQQAKAPAVAKDTCGGGDEEDKNVLEDPEAEKEPTGEDDADAAEAPAPIKPAGIPGFSVQTCKGPAEHPVITYYVQLPPEYDPYRRYPVIVTLNGAGTTPQQQIDWWAGSYSEQNQMRLGQASRRGYIVIAPVWQKEYQRKYEYSLREHACVLNSLRDAFRRFAVDSDKVFLTGHSMGGDAAWDIGLAHPDLWAGVMPIVATSDKYVRLYWENAALLPMYFVSGERDGNRLAENAVDWDRYLTKSHASQWDIMVVQYLGRGHEAYYDDIQHLFTWMDLHKRNFFPESFEARSMRPWDNFFWYVESEQFPAAAMVHPLEWTGEKLPRANPALTEGKKLPNNGISVDSAARKVTVWLSPEMVNFAEKINVNINNKAIKGPFEASIADLLEDARLRGDRQHPFWKKVQNF